MIDFHAFDQLPLYEINTLDYLVRKEKEEYDKMTEDQKGAYAISKAMDV